MPSALRPFWCLEGFDGGLCYLIITAGYLSVVEPQLGQTGLNLRDQFAGVAVFDRLSEGKIVGKGFFNRRGRFIGRVGVFVDIFLNRSGGRFAAWRDKLHVAVVAQDDLPRVVLPENFFT